MFRVPLMRLIKCLYTVCRSYIVSLYWSSRLNQRSDEDFGPSGTASVTPEWSGDGPEEDKRPMANEENHVKVEEITVTPEWSSDGLEDFGHNSGTASVTPEWSGDGPEEDKRPMANEENYVKMEKITVTPEWSGDGPEEDKRPMANRENYVKMEKIIKLLLDVEKPPTTRVNEIVAILRTQAEYTLVPSEDLTPLVTIRVQCDDNLIAFGSGPTKKEAKQMSAMALLEKIGNMGPDIMTSMPTESPPRRRVSKETNEKMARLETRLISDAVSALQELSMARHWHLPKYDFVEIKERNVIAGGYTATCTLLNFTTQGRNALKREAKRQAAYLMFEKIRDLPQEIVTTGEHEVSLNEKQNSTDLSTENLIPAPTRILTDQLKSSKYSETLLTLNNKRSANGEVEVAANLLRKIGKEYGFSPSYHVISDASKKDDVLVLLSILPIVSCVGAGKTVRAAEEAAAADALTYLKLLMKSI